VGEAFVFMAIVRTTSKETSTTGAAPPAVKPKAPAQTPQRVAGRTLPGRTAQPTTSAERGQFFSDVKAELRRVTWPSRETVRSGVIVTIGLLVFFALYIFGLDVIAGRLFEAVFTTGSTP
jgi:preprotein translocase subunit SecE